jgi:ketosteroid isomerase-like protein
MSTGTVPGKAIKPIGEARPTEPVKVVAEAPAQRLRPGRPGGSRAPAPAPAAPPAPAAVAAKPAEVAKPARQALPRMPERTRIARAIELWAAAWSRKDVKAYLGAYARDFKTPGGESRAAWDAERQKRISKAGRNPGQRTRTLRVSVDGDTATARFRQHYKSATLKTSSNKVLQLGKRDGKWQILQERVGG